MLSTSTATAMISDNKETDVPKEDSDVPKEDFAGTFTCSHCGMEETYHYKGSRPPFAKCLTFSEEAYIMKDPFSPPGKGKCLLLGSDCSKCGQPICCAGTCSVFYFSRFCLLCVKKYSGYFPPEILSKFQIKDN